MKQAIILLLAITFLISCDNDETDKLRKENAALKSQVDSITTNKEPEQKGIRGLYVDKKGALYRSFNFKGETSVVIIDAIFHMPFATSYVRDGSIIRVKTDKSDLMLNVVDDKTLSGEGFAQGKYIKREKNDAQQKD